MMMDGGAASFSNPQEELAYWKSKALEVEKEIEKWKAKAKTKEEEAKSWKIKAQEKQEELEELEESYNDFMDSSKQLEAEMERDLRKAETKSEEITRAYSLLKLQHEELLNKHLKNTQESAQHIERLQGEKESIQKELRSVMVKKRQLEQDNDDLQRRQREAEASISDLSEKLDKYIEENACLQSEVEEVRARDEELIQRLKEELGEQKSELAARNHTLKTIRTQGLAVPTAPTTQVQPTAAPLPCSNSTPNHNNHGSPLTLVNDMLHLVKDLEIRLSSYNSPLPHLLNGLTLSSSNIIPNGGLHISPSRSKLQGHQSMSKPGIPLPLLDGESS